MILSQPTENKIFERHESNVRSYCRNFPTVFKTAQDSWMIDTHGRKYLDFLSGAGALNYGHNNPAIINPVMAYMHNGGIIHSLDMYTTAKAEFLTALTNLVLKPRMLEYRIQFPGPTGTNAIEAALKLARKVTGRTGVIAFSNGFHGMTLGALSATANTSKRHGAGQPLGNTSFMPYEGYLGSHIDSMQMIEPMLSNPGSGIDAPAAFLVEMVQGEGGLNAASNAWIKRLSELARDIGALLIIDDIQAGNGRTGSFFSFEPSGIKPDIIALSKSLSGFGTPLSLVFIRPDLDCWKPGEHNGTFRGNNLAFVGATAAINTYWSDTNFEESLVRKSAWIAKALGRIVEDLPLGTAIVRGRGLFTGIAFSDPQIANQSARQLFEDGMVIETCGPRNEVLKLFPPLTISDDDLELGLSQIAHSVSKVATLNREFVAEPM
jgi:diaminobutyrate-2-oxoglutarate transaminase